MTQKSVALLIGNTRYPVTPKGEKKLKERLFAKYPADTLVEEWVDGNLINTLELRDVFN